MLQLINSLHVIQFNIKNSFIFYILFFFIMKESCIKFNIKQTIIIFIKKIQKD